LSIHKFNSQILFILLPVVEGQANGLRYPLVGGTRQRCFDGTNSKPREVPENAQTPTSRVHAVLGNFLPTGTLAFEMTQTIFHF